MVRIRRLSHVMAEGAPSLRYRVWLLLSACLMVAACGGGSDGPGDDDVLVPDTGQEQGSEETGGLGQDQLPNSGEIGVGGTVSSPSQTVPDNLAAIDRVALIIDAGSRCTSVDESFDVGITRALTDTELAAGEPPEPPDVSAYVTLTQSLGSSLELLSRSDGAVQLRLRQQDIVGLTAELDNGSVTAYLAAFADGTPGSVVLRKPIPDGCLYALRLSDFCATGVAKAGTLVFDRGDQGISATGCELQNPAGHPVVELQPPGQ